MTAPDRTPPDPAAPDPPGAPPLAVDHDVRAVLRFRAFRQLWLALSLSSLGDWLGLLATTALATDLAGSYSGGLYAIGGVLIFRLLPAVLLGPFAGAFADRFDRRATMVVCDLLRFTIFLTIPLAHSLVYLLAASFLVEAVSLFWIPAKEASVPNLLPRERLEAANQLSLLTTYGSAPVAAAVFALLAVVSHALASRITFFSTNPTDLALYFDAATFLFSAVTVARLREISGARRPGTSTGGEASILTSITEGWGFARTSPLVRGMLVGMLGAFAAGGAVIALGKPYVLNLGGGNAGYGVLFGALFTGLAVGMFGGPRLLRDFSRRRLTGLAIVGAGASLAVVAVLPNLVLAIGVVVVLGACAGVAWVVGYTLLGGEVADEVRGRTFALVQSLVRIDLLVVLAAAPFLSAAIGNHSVRVVDLDVRADGVTIVLFVAGLLGVVVGVVCYRQLDDRPGVPLWRDLVAALRHQPLAVGGGHRGLFVAFEGGEGAGKSTQAARLAGWLAEHGYEVVSTREPGATDLGASVRALLLDRQASVTPRAEALLYAADRAHHVATVVRPALDRGAVVVTDRYVDSSLAYQGAGRDLAVDDVARISRWATEALQPDLTVLLDVDPAAGRRRAADRSAPDRLEAEPAEFHARVRRAFRELAERDPGRYLVVPADLPVEAVAERVRARVHGLLGALRPAVGREPQAGPPAPAPRPDAPTEQLSLPTESRR